ncbi:MAG TPA: TonB-dependent receptor [Chryseolinea sp.]|nr:TonB-dependent receptor [Chryseolinea sp.]
MIHKYIILLVAGVFLFRHTCAQECNGAFTGRVLDKGNQPLIGAAIMLSNSQKGTITDASGNFHFDRLCKGVYSVKVQYLGYETLEFKITVDGAVSRILHLKEDIRQLQEVVVEDELQHIEHAHNLATLNAKQLAESAGKSLGESLKEIPGVNTIQTGPGIFKPVIHGVHSQRVLILNHGIRQEGQQWGAEHAPEIDPFIASDVSVIKDASSIKYGTDAIGGVIVVNPAPLPEGAGIGGSLNMIGQSNGRSGTVSGMMEGGLKNLEGWGWRVQGTAKRSGDFHTPSYSLTNTGIKELNFSASAGYHNQRFGFEVFFSHFNSELGILKGTSIGNQNDLEEAMERSIPLYTSSFSYTIGEPRQEVEHNLLKLSAHVKTKRGEIRLQYGFQNNQRKEFDLRIGDLSNTPELNLLLNTHTIEAEWETVRSEKWSVSTGATGMFQQNRKVDGTQRVPFIPDFNNISAGLFGVTKVYLNQWTIDVGARYDYKYYSVAGYDYKNSLFQSTLQFNNVSATAGATVGIKQNGALNLNISSAWRPPHVAELYSVGTHQSAAANEYGFLLNDSTNEVLDIDDVSFKTEQALKFVGTYQHRWSKFTLEMTPYVNYIYNYIYLRPTGISQNVRGTYAYFRYTQTDALFLGADISGVWRVHPFVKVTPKVSLLRASDARNDDYLVFIPSNWYEIAIRYDRPTLGTLKNFFIESKTRYVSRQNRTPRVVTVKEINDAMDEGSDPFENDDSNFDFMEAPSGYLLWNAAAGVSVKGEKTQYDFRIGAENILNTTYREYTNRFRYYADDLGSNFIISVKCIF